MNKCQYITKKESELLKCKFNSKYGNFCYKHRKYHLLDDEQNLIQDNFTFQKKDYNKIDLVIFCKKNKLIIKNKNKDDLFNKVCNYISYNNKYKDDLDLIFKIQKNFRRSSKQIYEKCNNSEDFYTFDNLKDISDKYFYHYKDNNNLLWGFDIRSLIKLISLNQNNPYTTEKFPEDIIQDIKKKYNLVKKRESYEDLQELDTLDRKNSIKQKTVDLFSDIELNGYSCQIDWFLKLNNRKLKELYRQLEDIWNYRLRYNRELKIKLVPPEGKLFTTPISDLLNYNNKEELQELILNDICKFKNIQDLNDRKLGYMYFLLGLSTVSIECSTSHEWISHAIM